jgi:hypothetical protein
MSDGLKSTLNELKVSSRRKWAMRHRRLPKFSTTGQTAPVPTIYYFAPPEPTASGGVRNMYRHVDELNSLGFRAAVMHPKAGFRCTWFANDTAVVGTDTTPLHRNDILVMPEFYGPYLDTLPAGVNVVIFNQKAYDTFFFTPYESTPRGAPYAQLTGLRGLLTVSQDNAELLAYAFPDIDVKVARLVLDPTLFHPGTPRRPRRIAFTAHRRAAELEQLLHMLRSRGALAGWELVPISGRTEQQTAEIMRSAPLFLSFSDREGFGLPPAEAMASGCYVIGFTGLAGREFFDPDHCTVVPDSDLLAFGRAVERVAAAYESDPDAIAKLGELASERVLARYTTAGLREDLEAFYRPLV